MLDGGGDAEATAFAAPDEAVMAGCGEAASVAAEDVAADC